MSLVKAAKMEKRKGQVIEQSVFFKRQKMEIWRHPCLSGQTAPECPQHQCSSGSQGKLHGGAGGPEVSALLSLWLQYRAHWASPQAGTKVRPALSRGCDTMRTARVRGGRPGACVGEPGGGAGAPPLTWRGGMCRPQSEESNVAGLTQKLAVSTPNRLSATTVPNGLFVNIWVWDFKVILICSF